MTSTPMESGVGAERQRLLAQLAVERAGLLAQLVNLGRDDLTRTVIFDGWTAKDLLAHAVTWDRWTFETMQALQAGQAPDLRALRDAEAFSAASAGTWRPRALEDVVDALLATRQAWQDWLTGLPDAGFFQEHAIDGQVWTFPGLMEVQWQHDAEHAGHIGAWREATQPQRQPGPKAVLRAALDTAREALLTAGGLVPPAERTTRLVAGAWTLKDLLGHISDWEWWVVDAVQQISEGRAPQVAGYESIQAWNEAHAAARQQQSWQVVWRDFQAGRRALLAVLNGMSQGQLERPYPAAWSQRNVPAYAWLTVVLLDHDLEHTHDLLAVLSTG